MKKRQNGQIMAKVFKKLLFIQIFAVLTATLGSIVDGVIISNFLGRDAMAAFSISMPVFVVLACLSNMVGNGAQTICGKALGKGEGDHVNGVFTLTLVLVGALGILFAVLLAAFSDPLAVLLGASGESVPLVADYIRGLSFGALAIMLNGPIMRFLQLDRASAFSFVGVLTMTVVNIAGDLLNVFVFKKGMFGMAAATSVSYYASLLLLSTHFFKKDAGIGLSFVKLKLKEMFEIVRIGLPTAISQGCNALKSVCLNHIFMGLAGTLFVAAYAGQNTVSQLIQSVSLGVGMTVLLVLSVMVGEEDRTSLVYTMKSTLKLSIVLNTVIALLVFVGADGLASMFGKGDMETRRLSAYILRLYAIGLPFSIINTVFQNYFQSIGKMKIVNLICVCHNLLFMVAFAFVLPKLFGKDSVWLLFPLTQAATLILIVAVVWIHNRSFPRSFEQLLMMDAGFGVPHEDRIDINVSCIDEVNCAAEQIEEFCRAHGVDEKRTQASALAMKEMAGNIVQHGFSDGKPHLMEGRFTYKEGQLFLRLKDDCEPFNPNEYLETADSAETAGHIGIRTVSELVKEMKYQDTFKLNVLTIEI